MDEISVRLSVGNEPPVLQGAHEHLILGARTCKGLRRTGHAEERFEGKRVLLPGKEKPPGTIANGLPGPTRQELLDCHDDWIVALLLPPRHHLALGSEGKRDGHVFRMQRSMMMILVNLMITLFLI
jgi:hypothetical protein